MAVEVHVSARVTTGRMHELARAVEDWRTFRRARGWAVPRVLVGLSGEMNSVLFVFEYADLGVYEREEGVESASEEYARVAGALPLENPIVYRIWRADEPA